MLVKSKDFSVLKYQNIKTTFAVIQRSIITDHRIEFSHDFDWNNVKILDKQQSLSKRLISEMVYIKKQKSSLSLQSDIELLDNAYL